MLSSKPRGTPATNVMYNTQFCFCLDVQVMLEYNTALNSAGVIDFEDMLSKAGCLLAVPVVKALVGKQYTHILVDEFQVCV